MAALNEEELRWSSTSTQLGNVAKPLNPEESNSVDLLNPAPKAIWVMGGGTMKVTLMGGSTVQFTGLPDDLYIDWLRIKRLWSTGTTATIIGIY